MTGGLHRAVLALTTLVAAVFAASPALAATAGGPTYAILVRPLSLVNTEDLNFASLISSPTAGTVTINENTGARTVTGGVTTAGGTPRRAEFVGVGRPGILSFVSISPNVTLTNGSGGTMTSTLAVEGGTGLRLFPGSGIQTFRIGGTLSVGANQAQGDYAGTFTMTVTYF